MIPKQALEQMKKEGWATLEEQAKYWKDRELSKTESAAQWFDMIFSHEEITDAQREARLEAMAEWEDRPRLYDNE